MPQIFPVSSHFLVPWITQCQKKGLRNMKIIFQPQKHSLWKESWAGTEDEGQELLLPKIRWEDFSPNSNNTKVVTDALVNKSCSLWDQCRSIINETMHSYFNSLWVIDFFNAFRLTSKFKCIFFYTAQPEAQFWWHMECYHIKEFFPYSRLKCWKMSSEWTAILALTSEKT